MATTQHCQPLSTQSFEIDIPHHNIGFQVQSVPMNDREEIRRRLAMDSDGEDCINSKNISNKRPFINKTMMAATNDLRLCFLNETPDNIEATRGLQRFRQEAFNRIKKDFISNTGNNSLDESQSINDQVDQLTNQLNCLQTSQEKPKDLMVNLRRNKMERFRFILNTARPNDMSSFHRYHNLIIAEARFALSQAKEMARIQMETERLKQSTKPSPIASLLQVPAMDKFSRSILRHMSIAKLQILVNDLHSRIEDLNEELVQILQERDELHMEQDSILVDIEDATIFLLRRIKHQNLKDSSRKSSQ